MNELATYQGNLPDTIADVAKFIILGQEKAKSLAAEIRAINRLDLAKEVYDQKQDELDTLRRLMLDAYQRMGDITRELPRQSAGRPEKIGSARGTNFYSDNDGEESEAEIKSPSCGTFEKSKTQAIKELGLSKAQVSRFETMSKHPEIVEQVKRESELGLAEPTQGEVLRRIKEAGNVTVISEFRQEKAEQDLLDSENVRSFNKLISAIRLEGVTYEMLDSVAKNNIGIDATMHLLNRSIEQLTEIRSQLTARRGKNGKEII